MIALQGYYNDGRLELAEKAPAKTASVLVIFPEEYPSGQTLKDDWATDVPNRETAEAIREGRAGGGLTNFLTGILKKDDDCDRAREESLRAKYEIVD